VNRTVAVLLGAAASMGALPPLPIRTDRSRPESPEAQALIQQRAAAKRARKRLARIKQADLTSLGHEHARRRVEILTHLGYVRFPFTDAEFADAKARYERAWEALEARRGQP
jgi:hypothetical protein